MKNSILPIIGLLLATFGMEANAQYAMPWIARSSTVGESYLNGAANLAAARGLYLNSLGNYQIQRSQALDLQIQNWKNRITTRWEIKDEWKDRNKTENFIQKKNRNLDNAVKRHALKQREKDLIEKGILPPKPKSGFWHKGAFFTSVEEWKLSPEYAQMIEERQENQKLLDLEREMKQKQLDLDMEEMRKFAIDSNYFSRKRLNEKVSKKLGEFSNSSLLDQAYLQEVNWLRKNGRIAEANLLEKFMQNIK
jgi:hypothetical protein